MTGENPDSASASATSSRCTRGSPRPSSSPSFSIEEPGVDLEIFSLRSPVDGRFHGSLARVARRLLPRPAARRGAWETLRRGRSALGCRLERELDELLEVSLIDACQAMELAARRTATRHHPAARPLRDVATTVARLRLRLADVPYSFTSTPRTSSTRGSTRPSSGPSSRTRRPRSPSATTTSATSRRGSATARRPSSGSTTVSTSTGSRGAR